MLSRFQSAWLPHPFAPWPLGIFLSHSDTLENSRLLTDVKPVDFLQKTTVEWLNSWGAQPLKRSTTANERGVGNPRLRRHNPLISHYNFAPCKTRVQAVSVCTDYSLGFTCPVNPHSQPSLALSHRLLLDKSRLSRPAQPAKAVATPPVIPFSKNP